MSDGHIAMFEDFDVGYRVESPYRVITESDVLAIGRFTNDTRAFMRTHGLGVVAPMQLPPLHTFSIGLCLLLHAEATYIPTAFVAFLGFASIDFVRPATVGMVIGSVATVVDLRPRSSTGEVVFRHETLDGDDDLLVRSEHALLVRKRS